MSTFVCLFIFFCSHLFYRSILQWLLSECVFVRKFINEGGVYLFILPNLNFFEFVLQIHCNYYFIANWFISSRYFIPFTNGGTLCPRRILLFVAEASKILRKWNYQRIPKIFQDCGFKIFSFKNFAFSEWCSICLRLLWNLKNVVYLIKV